MSKKKQMQDQEILDKEEDAIEADEIEMNIDDAENSTDTDGELDSAMIERNQYKDALQRERADFVNFKKRVERERGEMKQTITANTVAKFLPILDDFDRALSTVPDTEENGWVTGFVMIHKKFNNLLAQLGIESMDPIGEPFDPNLHEAVTSEDSDEYESDTVIEVLQKGYKLDDKVVRVAMVKVAN